MKPQLLIGSATSGSGKTTFTMGLLRALKKRGMRVQPFKCGPDYIDTQFHTLAADRESVNLDTWMASKTHVQHIYNKYGEGADACVAEGVMGLFDGYSKMEGSSAEIAHLLGIPVILVVSARATAPRRLPDRPRPHLPQRSPAWLSTDCSLQATPARPRPLSQSLPPSCRPPAMP